MAADPTAIVKRYESLRGAASTHFKFCDEMAPFLAPSRSGILSPQPVGAKQTRNVYDSTSMMAGELLAQFIASYSVNPSQQWGGMRLRGPEANDEMQEWFEDGRDRMLADFSSSMFYAEAPEVFIDWSSFGTGCLLTDEAPQPINRTIQGWRGSHYKSIKTGRFVGADGADGMVDTMMYEERMSAEMLVKQFGLDALPEKAKKAIKEGRPDEPFDMIHAIYPRSLSDQEYASGAQKMPYASCWVEKASKTLVRESGYTEFPGAMPRYQRTPGEFMGRGRGHIAFPDTWTLNTAKRMSLEDFALKSRPPILHAHDAVIGTLRLTPGGPTSINTHGRSIGESIMPFQTGSHPEVAQIKEEELRKSIRQIFFVDQILMLMEVNKSEMTAFEFSKKMELLFRVLGPVYGRVRKEFLERIWHTKFVQMFEAGAFPPFPPSFEQEGAEYDIVFENPLERAQRSGDVEAINLAIQDMAPLVQFYPQVLDWLGPDELAKTILRARGVSARVTNSAEQVKANRDAKQAQQEHEQDMAEGEQIATSAGKVAPLVKALQGSAA